MASASSTKATTLPAASTVRSPSAAASGPAMANPSGSSASEPIQS